MPVEFFRDILDEHFSDSETERQIDTALHWAPLRRHFFLRFGGRPDFAGRPAAPVEDHA